MSLSSKQPNPPQSKKNSIFLKNMVCHRCVDTVKRIARRQDLALHDAKIGEARFAEPLSPEQLDAFRVAVERNGFEILETRQGKLIESIKQILSEVIEEPDTRERLNISAILAKRLNYEYSHLSKLFSGSEGISIEQYFIQQRLEKAKELLAYGTLPITQIAEDLRFNSPSHFASSFKNATGLTPRAFREEQTGSIRYMILGCRIHLDWPFTSRS